MRGGRLGALRRAGMRLMLERNNDPHQLSKGRRVLKKRPLGGGRKERASGRPAASSSTSRASLFAGEAARFLPWPLLLNQATTSPRLYPLGP
ncbi:hypothetical protein P4O66_018782 [Electrophorus voltai]|uniref:Uncharacterized protein n=1 Tax=Electrophorus voltai TaxID=2609070 RepID=A0AAD8YS97_9TELE|nr:hypothetical protein P4O66_018782 [Electrophorus voltai]